MKFNFYLILLLTNLFSINLYSSATLQEETLPQSIRHFTHNTDVYDPSTVSALYITNTARLNLAAHKINFVDKNERDLFIIFNSVSERGTRKDQGNKNVILPQIKFIYEYEQEGKQVHDFFFWSIFYNDSPELKEPSKKKLRSEENNSLTLNEKGFFLYAYKDLSDIPQSSNLVAFISANGNELNSEILNKDNGCCLYYDVLVAGKKISVFQYNQRYYNLGKRDPWDNMHTEEQFLTMFHTLLETQNFTEEQLLPRCLSNLVSPINLLSVIINIPTTFDICEGCKSMREGYTFRKIVSKLIPEAFKVVNEKVKPIDILPVFILGLPITYYQGNKYFLNDRSEIFSEGTTTSEREKDFFSQYIPFEGDVEPTFSLIFYIHFMNHTPNDIDYPYHLYTHLKNSILEPDQSITWIAQSLNKSPLTDSNLASLGALLYENNGHLKHLDLSKCLIGKSHQLGFKILTPFLSFMTNLTDLDLSNNYLKDLKEINNVTFAFKQLVLLQKLSLHEMNIPRSLVNKFCENLGKSLAHMPILSVLELCNNNIYYEDFGSMYRFLRIHKGLTILDLSLNPVSLRKDLSNQNKLLNYLIKDLPTIKINTNDIILSASTNEEEEEN